MLLELDQTSCGLPSRGHCHQQQLLCHSLQKFTQKFMCCFLPFKAWASSPLQPWYTIINPSRMNYVNFNNILEFGQAGVAPSQGFVGTTKSSGDQANLSHYSASGSTVPDMWVTGRHSLLVCREAWVHREPRKALWSGSYLLVTDREGFGDGLINSTFIPL